MARHGVEDPSANLGQGLFSNEELQALYNEFIAKGLLSVQDALEVGVLIEQTDIADLEGTLDVITRFDIKRVFTNLLNGSYNHLEAFESGCDLVAATQ